MTLDVFKPKHTRFQSPVISIFFHINRTDVTKALMTFAVRVEDIIMYASISHDCSLVS